MLPCSACDFSAPALDKLLTHSVFAHGLTKISPFNCAICLRTVPNWKKFREHILSYHAEYLFSCENECMEHMDVGETEFFDAEDCVVDSTVKDCFLSDKFEGLYFPKPPNEGRSSEHSSDKVNFGEKISLSKCTEEKLFTSALNFVSKLYANPDLTRSLVQSVIDDVETLLSSNISALSSQVIELLESAGVDETVQGNVMFLLSVFKTPFKELSSEYLRFQALRKEGFFIDPVTFVCGRTTVSGVSEKVTAQFIPLRKTLKCFFELPNVLCSVERYVSALLSQSSHGIISNFIQGQLWKEKLKQFSSDQLVLPLFLFFDDFEINNVLGSHSGVYKVGAVYVWCPCLPPEFVSLLENYFLAMLFHSEDRKADDPYFETSNSRIVFAKLIDELNFLKSDGISVTTAEGTMKIYFSLGLILGDNLGLHSILGLLECFMANYPCRICKITKANSCCATKEDEILLRTVDGYQSDLALNDSSRTGLKEECVWNRVDGFHVIFNLIVDWMHDILEGVAKYDLCLILSYLISKGYFSLEYLNYQIINFPYGASVSNKPSPITSDNLKKNHLRMSSSEMLTLVQCLGPMVGCHVPQDDLAWQLFSLLNQIVAILMCKSLEVHTICLLETLISEHHKLYVHLFGNSLKPKHHFMLHYARVIKMCGPLIHLWSMRAESKHRISKRIANVVFSRRNILLSISTKHQLSFAFRLFSKTGFSDRLELSPKVCEFSVCDMSTPICTKVPVEFSQCISPSHIVYNGIRYKKGTCVIIGIAGIGTPVFGIIHTILVNSQRHICFLVNKLLTVSNNDHLLCYNVEGTEEMSCIGLSEMPWSVPDIHCDIGNGCTAAIVKHLL